MKQLILFIIVIAACYVGVSASNVRRADSLSDSTREAIKAIHTYDSFKEAYILFEEREQIITPENYEKFIDMVNEMYTAAFSEDEIHVIKEFLASSVGRKWLRFGREHDPWMEFAKRVLSDEDTGGESKNSWTCPDHPMVRIPASGECPICERPLKRK